MLVAYWQTVQQRLVSYLKDNQDQIVESWLTGAAVPDSAYGYDAGLRERRLLRFLEGAFVVVLDQLSGNEPAEPGWLDGARFAQLMEETAWCPCDGSRACFNLQLCDAGGMAFQSVLCETWDTAGEFTALERAEGLRRVTEALGRVLDPAYLRCFRTATTAGNALP